MIGKTNSIIIKKDSQSSNGNFLIKVIDYNGDVLKEEKLNTGDIFELPSVPIHDKLIFQEWSSPVDIIDNNITVEDSDIIIGPIYETISGLSEFDIVLTEATGLTVTFKMEGIKDWGDGTSDNSLSHTYENIGEYTIYCNGTSVPGYLALQTTSDINYTIVNARLSNSVINIDNAAFKNFNSLNNVTIANSVTSIGESVFASCVALNNIFIPKSVTSINSGVFSSCYSLTNIIIPNSIITLYSSVFNACMSLSKIIIPNSVTTIGANAFYNCRSLTNIVIPNNVTNIGSETFGFCNNITDITIPDSITSIGKSAFNNCYGIKKITLPDSVTSIGSGIFYNCYSLTKIVIPNSATSIGASTFYHCYCLKNIDIPNGVTSIEDNAFSYCRCLTNIKLPNSITSIGANSFSYCPNITRYDFSEFTSVPQLKNTNAFTSINDSCKIIVPSNLIDEWKSSSGWSMYSKYIVSS